MKQIRPNDVVKHNPTGEEWLVCGVNNEKGEIVPCGYPFPSFGRLSDCELIEARELPQDEYMINALRRAGLPSFIEGECDEKINNFKI